MDFSFLLHAATHALKETALLLPFLYLTYLLMELLEHKAGGRMENAIRRAGRVGPLCGGLLGMLPQCGFSAAAAGLYAGRVITVGTLVAVFLSTSDEMLPILVSNRMPIGQVLLFLLLKAAVGMVCGFLLDALIRPRTHTHEEEDKEIEELCRRENCHCEGKNVFLAALIHTLRVAGFILLVSFALGAFMEAVGEEKLASLMLNRPVLSPLFSTLIGLIPNCAASVVLCELYLGGALTFGGLFSGLLAGAGVGMLILFRVNRHAKENLRILGAVVLFSFVFGLLADLSGIGTWLLPR